MGGTLGCAGRGYTDDGYSSRPYGVKSPIAPEFSSFPEADLYDESKTSTWKFWRRFSTRRSERKPSERKDILKLEWGKRTTNEQLSGNNSEIAVDSLPDLIDRAALRRSQSLKPPPKPPRLFLFRSSSITTPRNSVTGGSTRNSFVMSQAYLGSQTKDPSNMSIQLVPNGPGSMNVPNGMSSANKMPWKVTENNNVQRAHNKVKIAIAEETSDYDFLNSSQISTRIKIVTPDLTPRRFLSRPRKKSGEITEHDRHRLILQSGCELICQKLDPSVLLDELHSACVISSDDLQAFRGHPDRRLVCESLLSTVMEGEYSRFVAFSDVLRRFAEYAPITMVLDAMKDIYSLVYDIPDCVQYDVPILEDEKSVTFDVGYYNPDTCVMKPVVQLEKARPDSKRFSRDFSLGKRSSRLSFQSISSDVTITEDETIQESGIPMVNVSMSGYSLHGDRASALATIVDKHICINELHLGKAQLAGKDIGTLALPLQRNTGITLLDLRLNNLGHEGATMLGVALEKNTTIMSLNLSSTGIGMDGCKSVADSLTRNSSLTDLDLSFLDIGDDGCMSLANMLKQNKTLRKLRLRSDNISWIGCGILFEGVQISKSLRVLDLSRNFIGDDGMEMMCRHFDDALSLVDLNLENCGITATGCGMLSGVVMSNKTLKHLDLSVNFIGDTGISKLSYALERNKMIKTLGLNMCGITNDGFSKLLDILESNPTLELLKLCYNRLGREHTNPSATSDDLRYRVRIVTSSNPKLKLLLWGNSFDES